MRPTNKKHSGTSFYDEVIHSTLKKLREVIGDEDTDFKSGDNKVRYHFTRELDNGDVITIYDWKEYRNFDENEIISWHVGGFNKRSTMNARYQIEMLIYNGNN